MTDCCIPDGSVGNRPCFCEEELLQIAEFHFGIDSQWIQEIKELPSYDDTNYHLIVKQEYREKHPSIVIKCTTLNTLGRVAFQIELCCFFFLFSLNLRFANLRKIKTKIKKITHKKVKKKTKNDARIIKGRNLCTKNIAIDIQ